MLTRDFIKLALACSCLSASTWAGEIEEEELLGMSLQELIKIEITSAGKKPQTLNEIPAAVFVVTQEDIRRSGATTLPDILRMVPGMHVVQINAQAWGVSARGNNDYFANKMLVMVDGRSVYVREFSGVWWDHLNLVLEDIERIEVIRGPGGTLWGANAVNGIINIITKAAENTHGGLLSVAAGDQQQYLAAARYGDKLDQRSHFRVYAQSHAQETPDAGIPDPGRNTQVGFRLDSTLSERDDFTLQGDYYRGASREIDFTSYAAPPADETYHGGNLLAHWTRRSSNAGEWQAQTYFDTYQRDTNFVMSRTHTFDVDLQHRFRPHARHELVWGMNWRHYDQHSDGSVHFRFIPEDYTEDLYSVFGQDEITLKPERWRLIAGAKFEYTEQTDWEAQPSLRLLWTPNSKRSLWAAASHAVRMPDWGTGRSDFRIYLPPELNPYHPFPAYMQKLESPPELDSEQLTAYELGWRETLRDDLLLDATAYTHKYKELFNMMASEIGLRPDGIAQDLYYLNQQAWNAYGTEWALNWQPTEAFQAQAAYTYFNEVMPAGWVHIEPKHQFSLRGHWQINADWQADAWLRYAGDIPENNPMFAEVAIEHYTELDLRLAWRAAKNMELSLAGRNLLHHDHHEHRWAPLNHLYLPTERSFYGQVRWNF